MVDDFNGDGKSDLVTGDWSDNTVSVLLGNGNGTFQARHCIRHRKHAKYAGAVADFNGDGVKDLVAAALNGNCGPCCSAMGPQPPQPRPRLRLGLVL